MDSIVSSIGYDVIHLGFADILVALLNEFISQRYTPSYGKREVIGLAINIKHHVIQFEAESLVFGEMKNKGIKAVFMHSVKHYLDI